MANIGVEIQRFRCPDGAEWLDYGPAPEPLAPDDMSMTMLSGGVGGPDSLAIAMGGVWIRNRSAEMQPYSLRMTDLTKSVSEKFLNCSTPAEFAGFVTEYGIPGASEAGGVKAYNVSMKHLESVQDDMLAVLTATAIGAAHARATAFNHLIKRFKGTSLKPLLSVWPGDPHPTMSFEPSNLYGYMAMELSLLVSNAAAFKICLNCNSGFFAGTLTNKRTTAFYCSNRCRVAHQRAAKALQAKPAPA